MTCFPSLLGAEGAGVSGIKFDDPKVCKSFLMGCCPHEILASTVSSLNISYQFFIIIVHRVVPKRRKLGWV